MSPLSGAKFGVPGASDAMKKVCAERPGKKRREALRKTTAAQRPLKIGREAEKTVLCPVYEAPRIKRPPSYGKNKARSGANCGRCWARSRENFGMWASCGMTGASSGALCLPRRGRRTGETFYLCRGKKRLCSDLRNRYLTPVFLSFFRNGLRRRTAKAKTLTIIDHVN